MGIVIALDLDGVILDVLEAKRRALTHHLGRRFNLEQAVNGSFKSLVTGAAYQAAMERMYVTNYFLSFCEPYRGVQEVLDRRHACGDQIWIVSKAHGLSEDLLWLWCQRFSIPHDQLVTRRADKVPFYAAADVVVEDTPKHLAPHVGVHKGQLVLFRHESRAENYDRIEHPFTIARNWRELGQVLDKSAELLAA